jgi:hypothetical protein
MDDHEVVCPTCAARGAAGAPASGAHVSTGAVGAGVVGPGAPASGGLGVTGTAVMERPAPAAAAPALRYRQPGRGRRVAGWMVVLGVLVTAAVVLGAMAVRHQGPFADLAVDAGLIAPPLVDVPDRWTLRESEAGRFEVVMPVGSEDVMQPVDPADPARGDVVGYSATLGEGGDTTVISAELAMGVDPAQLDDARLFADLMSMVTIDDGGPTGQGITTVRRPVRVPNGRAMDVVIVDDVNAATVRARYLLAGTRLYAIVTAGLDQGAAALDEVHARVLDTFEVTE